MSEEGEDATPAPVARIGKRLTAEQQALIVAHRGMVIDYVNGLRDDAARAIGRQDLLNIGMNALAEAAVDYDKSRAKFSTFSHYRLHGALSKALAAEWKQSSLRREAQRVAFERAAGVEVDPGSPFEPDEASVDKLDDLSSALLPAIFCATTAAEHDGSGGEEEVAEALDRPRINAILADAIAAMPERFRILYEVYYCEEGATLEDVGERSGLSTRTVQRDHDAFVAALREALRKHRVLAA